MKSHCWNWEEPIWPACSNRRVTRRQRWGSGIWAGTGLRPMVRLLLTTKTNAILITARALREDQLPLVLIISSEWTHPIILHMHTWKTIGSWASQQYFTQRNPMQIAGQELGLRDGTWSTSCPIFSKDPSTISERLQALESHFFFTCPSPLPIRPFRQTSRSLEVQA